MKCIPIPCDVCGAPILTYKNLKTKYCSDTCRYIMKKESDSYYKWKQKMIREATPIG